ncbi:MAG TPA: hypothetical protein VIL12_04465 [Acidimicrobiia bacterium]
MRRIDQRVDDFLPAADVRTNLMVGTGGRFGFRALGWDGLSFSVHGDVAMARIWRRARRPKFEALTNR